MNECVRCEEAVATVTIRHTSCCGDEKSYCAECVETLRKCHDLGWCEACADASMDRDPALRPSVRGDR